MCKLLKVKHKNIVPRAPWMNPCERKNPFLSYYLKFCLLDGIKLEEWPKWLKYVSYSINSSYNRGTGYSPLEILYGTEFDSLNLVRTDQLKPPKEYDEYLRDLQLKFSFIWEKSRENIEKSKEAAKKNQDSNSNSLDLKVGNWVLWKNPKQILSKTDVPWLGPFKVIEVKKTSAMIVVHNKHKLVPINHLRGLDS